MPPEQQQAAVLETFRDEAKHFKRLSHPSIVCVYDFNIMQSPRDIPAPYMVLEWLDGEPRQRAHR